MVSGAPSEVNYETERLRAVIWAYPPDRRYALAAMQDIQHNFDYLPQAGLKLLAEYMGCPVVQLYSMATFYKALSLVPKGRHIIKVCDGTACHIKSSQNLIDGIQRDLGIRPGDTTADGQFSVETVNCLGTCALAPVLLVDGTHFGKVTMGKLPEIIDSYRMESGDVEGGLTEGGSVVGGSGEGGLVNGEVEDSLAEGGRDE